MSDLLNCECAARCLHRNYLAHEYFNRDWLPMPFARMAEWLAPTKLSYACSTHYLDHIDALNLTAEQQALLGEIPDAMFRETVRDFCMNQQFRRDYWVKGPRKLNGVAQAEALRAQRVILVQPRADVSLKVNGSLGEATMQEAVPESSCRFCRRCRSSIDPALIKYHVRPEVSKGERRKQVW